MPFRASSRVSFVTPAACSSSRARPRSSSRASSRCSVATNSSVSAFASTSARSSTVRKPRLGWGMVLAPEARGRRPRSSSTARRRVGTSVPAVASSVSATESCSAISASSRWTAVSSGLPADRARSAAAWTASWALTVSRLKSMAFSVSKREGGGKRRRGSALATRDGGAGWLPEHEVLAVGAVHLVDAPLGLAGGLEHRGLERADAVAEHHHLVLQGQHVLGALQREPEPRRELRHAPHAVEVVVGVQAGSPGRAARPDQAALLVHPQRLRVHAEQLGRDADHVLGGPARTHVNSA